MTIELSPRLQSVFRDAGWSERRAVDASKQVAFLNRMECPVGPLAEQFLRNCMGLKISGTNSCHLDVDVETAAFFFPEREGGRYLESFMGEPGCPVAYFRGEGQILIIGVRGRVIKLKDDWLGYFDNRDLSDALESMLVPGQYLDTWRFLERRQQPREFRDPDASE